MLVPLPAPRYTLAPDLETIAPDELAAIERALRALSGYVGGVVVTSIASSGGSRVIELATARGAVLLFDSGPAVAAS